MSIQNIDVRRVSALPGTLIANTIYLVKADGQDLVSMFVTNNDGTIEAQQVGLIHRGDYAAGTAYIRGDLALDQNSTWLNLRGSTGTAPPTLPTSSNADWQLFAKGGADGSPGAAAVPAGSDGDLQFKSGAVLAGGGPSYDGSSGALSVSGSFSLPDTVDDHTGLVKLGGRRFAHNGGNVTNTFVGRLSGNTTMTGANNTSIGSNSMKSVTTGQRNSAIGAQALIFNSTGSFNMAIGFYAMRFNTTGSRNVAIGDVALYGGSAPNRNVAIGFASGYRIDDGANNTFIGDTTGDDVTTGDHNTFLGSNAGQGVTTGAGNVRIGGHSTEADGTVSNTFKLHTGLNVLRMSIDSSGHTSFEGCVKPKSYTVSTLPNAAAVGAGSEAFCTNETGGAVPVFSDGTDWRRCTDRAIAA